LQDDTEVFNQAYKLNQEGERTQVWVLEQSIAAEEYQQIKHTTVQWYTEGRLSQYNLPKRDGTFNPNEYNCAVFPKLLGISIPINNGKVYVYIEKMIELGAKEWHPTYE